MKLCAFVLAVRDLSLKLMVHCVEHCRCPDRSRRGKEGRAIPFGRLFRKKHGEGTISGSKKSMKRRWLEW